MHPGSAGTIAPSSSLQWWLQVQPGDRAHRTPLAEAIALVVQQWP